MAYYWREHHFASQSLGVPGTDIPDGNLAADSKALRLVEQTFSDTLAALERLSWLYPRLT
ncbi:MAG: hypothetical protein WBP51_17425 [Candidatus Sulfotelmatobacter sp.]